MVHLKIYNYFKNMIEENISQEFRLKKYMKQEIILLKKIEQNKSMSNKHKKVCTTLMQLYSTLSYFHFYSDYR